MEKLKILEKVICDRDINLIKNVLILLYTKKVANHENKPLRNYIQDIYCYQKSLLNKRWAVRDMAKRRIRVIMRNMRQFINGD